jgi:SAM-dependent methyltransferase
MTLVMAQTIEQHAAFRPELKLVLACARTRPDESARNRIEELTREPLNWSDVVATAFEHHLESLLLENLAAARDDVVPKATKDLLRDTCRKASGTALLLSSEFLRVQAIFDSAELPLIPYKGPILAWLAYGSLTRRRYLDLDYFLEQKNLPSATALLKFAEFRADFQQREEVSGSDGPVPGQYGFYREATRSQVELHTERTLRYYPVPLNFSKMRERLLTVEISGREVRTFSIEDTLIMLCVHGAKHFWERLAWIVDIAELIARQPVDWTLALGIATKLKSRRLLLLGLSLAHDLFGAQIPDPVIAEARRDANVGWLANRVYDELAGAADPRAGVIPRAMFRLRSGDGVPNSTRHMLRLISSPTLGDHKSIRLPRMLSPLYAFVRPLNLMRQYGLGLRGRKEPDLAGYLPMRPEVVDRMLKFAGAQPGDVLYDLGCGDGRIVISAAKQLGIRAVGVDIDPRRIAESKANARKQGVGDKVEFLLKDALSVDLSEATVVTLYLETCGNLRLVDSLKRQLKPGARIISCDAEMLGWPCNERQELIRPGGEVTRLYLWRITA